MDMEQSQNSTALSAVLFCTIIFNVKPFINKLILSVSEIFHTYRLFKIRYGNTIIYTDRSILWKNKIKILI